MSKLFREIENRDKEYFDLYTTEEMIKYGIVSDDQKDKRYTMEAGPVLIAVALAAAVVVVAKVIDMIIKYIKNRSSNITSAENQVRKLSVNFDDEVRKYHDEVIAAGGKPIDTIVKGRSGGWKMRDLLIFQKKITQPMLQEAIKEDLKHIQDYTVFMKEVKEKAIAKLPEIVNKILSSADAKPEETSKVEENKKALEELEKLKADLKEVVDKGSDLFKFDRTEKIVKVIKPDFSFKFIDVKKASQDEIRGSVAEFNEAFKAAVKVANEKVDINEAIVNGAGIVESPNAETVLPKEGATEAAADKEEKELQELSKKLDELEKTITSKYKDVVVPPASSKAAKEAIGVVRSTVNLAMPLSRAIYDIYISHLGLYRRYIEVAIVTTTWGGLKDKPKTDEAEPSA